MGYRVGATGVVHGPWGARVHRVVGPPGTVVRERDGALAGDSEPPRETAGRAGRRRGGRTG
ncbi:hypothetical protein AB0D78_29155 [Streptomyces avermitilis]|uniref:hypothetical protein n=1 Tax=Streptomyces avermitilis TaxID=33903 RepID=UPI0033D03FB7